jgi:hypothetical protein
MSGLPWAMRQPHRALTADELADRQLVNDLWCALHGHDPEKVGLGATDEEWDGMCERVRGVLQDQQS